MELQEFLPRAAAAKVVPRRIGCILGNYASPSASQCTALPRCKRIA